MFSSSCQTTEKKKWLSDVLLQSRWRSRFNKKAQPPKKHIHMLYISNWVSLISLKCPWLTHQHAAKVPLRKTAHINKNKLILAPEKASWSWDASPIGVLIDWKACDKHIMKMNSLHRWVPEWTIKLQLQQQRHNTQHSRHVKALKGRWLDGVQ